MSDPTPDAPRVPIADDEIRLGQFLKLADLAESGSEARELIAEGEVRVNGEVDVRRGRRLVRGDVVVVATPQGELSAVVG
ncbi:RNA-binding S4 domain-containing protein [Luteimicrobium sp. NPDC057192]|uniref:RNA-binding S4 domain-containing protein n=1 Tax=Luteimicrobium sp. NPDC057192 TaxID=3346042 RepID=UPI003641A6D7